MPRQYRVTARAVLNYGTKYTTLVTAKDKNQAYERANEVIKDGYFIWSLEEILTGDWRLYGYPINSNIGR